MYCVRIVLITSLAAIIGLPKLAFGEDYTDPLGDTFGVGTIQHDIVSLHTSVSATDLHLNLTFNGAVLPASDFAPASIYGYIDLDVDRNVATGITVADASFATGRGGASVAPGLGIEFFIDLFSESSQPGSVDLINAATLLAVGTAPISFSAQSFALDIPLTLMGGGEANFGIQVGTLEEPTDELTGIVPEPSTAELALIPIIAVWTVCRLRKRIAENERSVTALPLSCGHAY